ncbi:MAG: DUF1156 domain-containing protein [Gemmatimonadetes bacterium]|nr:DUF1156 domain-containing protein [Gemmatimonadota bacterium]MYB70022.1 DUF1156 domain-containing protein [Gemmatimonadota bacterium]
MTDKRLIEVAFPLKQVSLDSVHEKNVRHGHISTLHIWPARRPLAASRAALIATLLADPGDSKQRQEILERMAGRVVEKIERKRVGGRVVEKVKEETVGGILHWGRENDPDLAWFREEIRKAYGGRAPKVLDPFAGGGAIPLEAMRLGCDVTAMDINPVAWFILKCTLEYPQKLAGQTRPLPEFALEDGEFMEAFLKAKGFKGASLRTFLERLGHGDGGDIQLDLLQQDDPILEADLAWHVRTWGRWVLAKARTELAAYYPTYAEFEPLKPDEEYAPRPMRLLEVDDEGIPQVDPLNAEFDAAYLKNPRNPRWIAKPTVAYLWARTVTCKQCRATLPLLKTRWLCKKDRKRVLLTMESKADQTGVVFGVQSDVPHNGGNAAQRREHDKRIGAGTMSRTGATCPCCGAITTMEDIRFEGRAGRLGAVMTAVVVDGPKGKGKEYRLPTDHERSVAEVTEEQLQTLYADIPFGLPEEPIIEDAKRNTWCVQYGENSWRKLFTNRQLLALGAFVLTLRRLMQELDGWPESWREALIANLALVNDRLADYSSAVCSWHNSGEKLRNTFGRFALPIVWDYTEVNPLSDTSGNFLGALDWVSKVCEHLQKSVDSARNGESICASAITCPTDSVDLILTDPPYYDSIGYSVLMDFFYVWLRRSTHGLFAEVKSVFSDALGPKWDHGTSDGELIDDASRFDGDKERSKQNYEDGMARSFRACHAALQPDGRLVVVFANKHPDAWETLVAALIRAGFVVDGSWPIQTEMSNRTRSLGSAALASSVWIVCKKRPPARPGWDTTVLNEMRNNITQQLRDFWDVGIRGPDFVWAATGPALEAFSKHPVVKKANDPNQLMSVSEFLREVRRMVVDFVVGRVLTQDGDQEAATGLDDVTTYYLLHRHDFGMAEAPVGGCILYALSCNLSDSALVNQHDLLAQAGKGGASDEPEEDNPPEDAEETSGGAKVKLKPYNRRQGRNLGLEAPGGRPVPLIDQVHKLMHLWRAGDQVKVDDYLDTRSLQRNALFNQILQALIELADAGSDERSILEALSNHVAARGGVQAQRQRELFSSPEL